MYSLDSECSALLRADCEGTKTEAENDASAQMKSKSSKEENDCHSPAHCYEKSYLSAIILSSYTLITSLHNFKILITNIFLYTFRMLNFNHKKKKKTLNFFFFQIWRLILNSLFLTPFLSSKSIFFFYFFHISDKIKLSAIFKKI